VPATSAAFSKGIFAAATNRTNQRNKAGGMCHLSVNLSLDVCDHTVRKELLSRINPIYYGRSFCKTHDHYSYLQFVQINTKGKLFSKYIKSSRFD
jgi:hypothetical protein